VWRVLGAVRTEFGKFGGVLDKVHRQLNTVTRTIEETGTRTRVMERRLRAVEQHRAIGWTRPANRWMKKSVKPRKHMKSARRKLEFPTLMRVIWR